MKILRILLVTILFLFFFTFSLLILMTFPPRIRVDVTPQSFGLAAKELSFLSKIDHIPLKGLLVLGKPSRPTILLCHGMETTKEYLFPLARFLVHEGWNVFLFDFRAHGDSGGRVSSFGFLEQRDLEGAVNALSRSSLVRSRALGVHGLSMGASVSLLVAAHEKRLRAVVADSPYVDLEEVMMRRLELAYHLPEFPFRLFGRWSYFLRFRVWPDTVAPIRVVGEISPRPVLFIYGEKDHLVGAERYQDLYRSAGRPKDLWIVPDAGHGGAWAAAPTAYEEKVTAFFQRYLGESR